MRFEEKKENLGKEHRYCVLDVEESSILLRAISWAITQKRYTANDPEGNVLKKIYSNMIKVVEESSEPSVRLHWINEDRTQKLGIISNALTEYTDALATTEGVVRSGYVSRKVLTEVISHRLLAGELARQFDEEDQVNRFIVNNICDL